MLSHHCVAALLPFSKLFQLLYLFSRFSFIVIAHHESLFCHLHFYWVFNDLSNVHECRVGYKYLIWCRHYETCCMEKRNVKSSTMKIRIKISLTQIYESGTLNQVWCGLHHGINPVFQVRWYSSLPVS